MIKKHNMEDIETRNDINILVKSFYSIVREDKMIGPVFNKHVSNWEEHYEILTNFWEMHLFRTKRYRGNPIYVHNGIDSKESYKIGIHHFGAWIDIWVKKIDELYAGKNADVLKLKARKMGTNLHVQMFRAKQVEG